MVEKCFKSEAYARLVALDWLAAMKRSAVAEKPSRTASGCVGDWLPIVVVADLRVEILVILKGFLAVDNCVLSLPEV